MLTQQLAGLLPKRFDELAKNHLEKKIGSIRSGNSDQASGEIERECVCERERKRRENEKRSENEKEKVRENENEKRREKENEKEREKEINPQEQVPRL